MSPALTRIGQRALVCSPEDIRAYAPTPLDLKIAESMLGGCLLFKDIGEAIGINPDTVGRALKNPVRCGWISQAVHGMIRHRLGMVDAALMQRALSGDVRAIELAYKRFDQLTKRSAHLNINLDFDPSKLPEEELDLIIAARNLPPPKDPE